MVGSKDEAGFRVQIADCVTWTEMYHYLEGGPGQPCERVDSKGLFHAVVVEC